MKILLATDGSDFSRAVTEKAAEFLAKGNGDNVEIEIVSVYENIGYTATEPFAVSAEYVHEMEKLGREQASKFAGEAEELLRHKLNNGQAQITTKILKGAPGRAIVEEAGGWGADLIVVGSHGRGFWGRAFLGSTSDKIIHQAPCSVLVVRKNTDANADDETQKAE